MGEITGALRIIRQRVLDQQILEIERKAARDEAEQWHARSVAKMQKIIADKKAAELEWPLTPREVKMWDKRILAASKIAATAYDRLKRLP